MTKQLAVSAAFAVLGLAVPAFASPVTYEISGSQQNGTFSGSITYDPGTGLVSGGTISAYPTLTATAPDTFTFSSDSGSTSLFSDAGFGPFFANFTLVLGGTKGSPTISTSSGAAAYVHGFPSGISNVGGDAVTAGTITPDAPTGGAAVTPEPSSIALLGTGLLGVAGAVRRRFRR